MFVKSNVTLHQVATAMGLMVLVGGDGTSGCNGTSAVKGLVGVNRLVWVM